MLTLCWAPKGGSGTTVYTAAAALAVATPTLLVDLDGDLPMVLGLPEPEGPGVFDWLRSDAPADRLPALEHRVAADCGLLAAGRRSDVDARRWAELADRLADDPRRVFVDAGTGPPPDLLREVADRTLLVTKACYLSLRHAVADGIVPSGIVLVDEPGRRLRAADVEDSLGAPVIATVLADPAIARAADSGLLVSRLPGGLRRQLTA